MANPKGTPKNLTPIVRVNSAAPLSDRITVRLRQEDYDYLESHVADRQAFFRDAVSEKIARMIAQGAKQRS